MQTKDLIWISLEYQKMKILYQ